MNNLKKCGFEGGKVMFDCNPLKPSSTPNVWNWIIAIMK